MLGKVSKKVKIDREDPKPVSVVFEVPEGLSARRKLRAREDREER